MIQYDYETMAMTNIPTMIKKCAGGCPHNKTKATTITTTKYNPITITTIAVTTGTVTTITSSIIITTSHSCYRRHRNYKDENKKMPKQKKKEEGE